MAGNADILLVDDELDLRAMLSETLLGEGYSVVSCSDGQEAVEQLRRRCFDVAISDVRMPRLGGLELLRLLKEVAPDTEVVLITGYASLEMAIEALRHGAFDFVRKPFDLNDLLATVARAVEFRLLRSTTALYRASQVIFATESHNLPAAIVEVTRQVMKADDVSLMLPDPNGRLYIAHSHAISPEIQAEVRLAIGERVAGRIAATGRPVLIPDDLARDSRFADIESFGRVRSSIVYPIRCGEHLTGVLNISRARGSPPYRQQDLEMASILASEVLLALENARLAEKSLANERLAAVGRLAASITHEINNPVTYLLAEQAIARATIDRLDELAARFENGAGLEELKECWRELGGRSLFDHLLQSLLAIGEGAERIRDISRDLRAMADGQSEREIIDLNNAIRTAVRFSRVEMNSIESVEVELGRDVFVRGREGLFSQVFVNLLVNAAHATAGRPGGRIRISTERRQDRVVATVADNGPGIASNVLARIFEPFFTTRQGNGGTGLGLAICREIVHSHGGRIAVESTPGNGAKFVVELPAVARARVQEVQVHRRGRDPAAAATPAFARRLTLLFVDDEPQMLRAYQRTFGREHRVLVAQGGEEAISLLRQEELVDLVICDLLMPGMDGTDLFRQACALRPELRDAFVFVTGGVTKEEYDSFLKKTGLPVIEKPSAFTLLPSVFRDFLNHHSGREDPGNGDASG